MANDHRRIPLLRKEEWTDRARDLFAVLEGPDARERGPRYDIVLQLAQNPELTIPFLEYNKHLMFHSSLDHRTRELAILYVAWTCRSEYEWLSHVRDGLKIGLSDADIEAVKDGPRSPHWDPFERDLMRLVDEMRDSYDISDEIWQAMSERFDPRQMMDLIFTIGNYIMFSSILNGMRARPEAGAEGEDLARKYGRP
ncbi:MAG TPA: carboxymuconolactone decarboxylase family protein [Novosphingobium sp.]|nr:carboxymuconolactone decarboxylase family protein [Novosphingobium sp.]